MNIQNRHTEPHQIITDLAEEANWEDSEEVEFETLEAAELEDAEAQIAPCHDLNSVVDYVRWWSDGEDSRYEVN